MISRAKKYVAVLLVFVCVCMIFSPRTAYAAEDSSQHETVKVGFFAMDGYHVMDEEGNRSGLNGVVFSTARSKWLVSMNSARSSEHMCASWSPRASSRSNSSIPSWFGMVT